MMRARAALGKSRAVPPPTAVLCALLSAAALGAAFGLGGCASIGNASGALAGTATGLVTANPAVGVGVGIAVQAAADEAVNRILRKLHRNQQDAIAQTAGALAVGASADWRVRNPVPLENGHGQVRVLRDIVTPLAQCKEFAFSLQDGNREEWYVASACAQGQAGWQWDTAEPAVARWGTLQQ